MEKKPHGAYSPSQNVHEVVWKLKLVTTNMTIIFVTGVLLPVALRHSFTLVATWLSR